MARKKRVSAEAVLNNESILIKKEVASQQADQLRTALYARLSVEDNGKIDGESIENQVEILKNYVKDKEEFSDCKLYVDNGVTGTVFSRPAFDEMLTDMKVGKIQCIIVKDLSRLGRNYLESGTYIEQIFPFFHIRFISILDGYDSFSSDAADMQTLLPVKNIMNDLYAKDISQKVIATFRTQQRQGKYIGSFAPYGYQKDPEDMYHLIIAPETAKVVREIYEWKLQGSGYGAIAKRLNDRGERTRYGRLYDMGLVKADKYRTSLWTRKLVKQILTNEVYIGNVVSGREQSNLAEGYKRKAIGIDRWYRAENVHEPIIAKADFAKVQEMIAEIQRTYESYCGTYDTAGIENLFKGKIRCGKCNSAMHMMKQMQRDRNSNPIKLKLFYECPLHEIQTKVSCKNNTISKEALDQIVLDELKIQLEGFLNIDKAIKLLNGIHQVHDENYYSNEVMTKERRIIRINHLSEDLYKDYKDGILNAEDYLRLKKNYIKETDGLKKELKQLKELQKKESENHKNRNRVIADINEYIDFDVLTQEMVDIFIESVKLYNQNQIKITYNFRDELQVMKQEITEGKREQSWLRQLHYIFAYQKKTMMSKAV